MPKKGQRRRPKKEDEAAAAAAAEDSDANGAAADGDAAADEEPSSSSLTRILKTENGKQGWTAEADAFILSFVGKRGKGGKVWEDLSAKFEGNRTASGVRSRWYMLAGPSANLKGGWVQKRKLGSFKGDRDKADKDDDEREGAEDESAARSPSPAAAAGGDDGDAQPDSSSVARTSSGGARKKQRIESASELGISTRTSSHESVALRPEVIGPPLPQRDGRTAFYLAGVAPHLTCKLCDQLFTDAHTICECLHTFCKVCLEEHIEEHHSCPDCGIRIKEGTAVAQIRSDHALKNLVAKIKKVLTEQMPVEEDEEDEDDETGGKRMMSPTNKERTARKALTANAAREGGHTLRITLTPAPEQSPGGGAASATPASASPGSADARAGSPTSSPTGSPTRLPPRKLRRPRLAVTDRVTVFHLKQFLAAAFAVRSLKQVEILCVGAALGDDMSLEYVLKTHWRGHAENELLALNYQLREG